VTDATRDSVTLNILRPFPVDLGQRSTPLPEDEHYRIIWSGGGFRVQRKMDGAFVSSEVPTIAAAEIELRQQYPERGKVA
jgi:hypothetical protein